MLVIYFSKLYLFTQISIFVFFDRCLTDTNQNILKTNIIGKSVKYRLNIG